MDTKGFACGLTTALLILTGCASHAPPPPAPPQTAQDIMRAYHAKMDAMKAVQPAAVQSSDGIQLVFQTGHANGIGRVAISADGRYIVTSDGTVIKIWDVASHNEVRSLFPDSGSPYLDAMQGAAGASMLWTAPITLTPDGRQLLTTNHDNMALYDLTTGNQIVRKQLLSPDARFGVDQVVTPDQQPTLTDLKSGEQAKLPVSSVTAFSDGGGYLVADKLNPRESAGGVAKDAVQLLAGAASIVPGVGLVTQLAAAGVSSVVDKASGDEYESMSDLVVLDVRTRQKVLTLPGGGDGARKAIISDRAGQLLLQQADRSIDAYPLRGGPKRQVVPADSGSDPTILTQGMNGEAGFLVSPSGREVARRGSEGQIEVFDLATGHQVLELASDDYAAAASNAAYGGLRAWDFSWSFSADGKWLASGDRTQAGAWLRVWEMPGGRLVLRTQASSIAFAADGQTAVLATSRNVPVVHNLITGKEDFLGSGVQNLTDVAVTADGKFAIASSTSANVTLWDLATGHALHTIACANGEPMRAAVPSPRQALVAVLCSDGSVRLMNPDSGEVVEELALKLSSPGDPGMRTQSFGALSFSGDGTLLALKDGLRIVVWDVAAHHQLGQVDTSADPVESIYDRDVAAQMVQQTQASTYDEKTLKQFPKEQREQMKQQQQAAAQQLAQLQAPEAKALRTQMAQIIKAFAVDPVNHTVAVLRQDRVSTWDYLGDKLLLTLDNAVLADKPSGQAPSGNAKPSSKQPTSGNPSLDRAVSQMRERNSDTEERTLLVMVTKLAFTAEGGRLYAGPRLRWDVATGRRIDTDPKASPVGPQSPSDELLSNVMANLQNIQSTWRQGTAALSPDGSLWARVEGNVVKLYPSAASGGLASDQSEGELVGHTAFVTALAFAPDGNTLLSSGRDGALRVWNVGERRELAAFYALGDADFLTITPDQYYLASRKELTGISFRLHDALYPFEQFDLRFDRPDIVMQRLGRASADEILGFKRAHERRMKKLGFTDEMLNGDFHLPQIQIRTAVPAETMQTSLTLQVQASDDQSLLDRTNVFVNDVPVFGTAGVPASARDLHREERQIEVPLVPGPNKIQVAVLDQQGVESLKQTVYTVSNASQTPSEVYIVGIGVSHYRNSRYDLHYAAKDAIDLVRLYKEASQATGAGETVHFLDLTDDRATRAQINRARDWLKQTHPNDLVIVFAAGHGMTDDQQNYYFGTYDIDPDQPQLNGLPYEELEGLLDGIPALKKLLLVDTCFSGEVDKDEPAPVARPNASTDETVTMRAFKAVPGVAGPEAATSQAKRSQDVFVDLRRGTGALVISSASADEYALEGGQWHNGIFTYALLSGLKGEADLNHDGVIMASELQAYVLDKVRQMTGGAQNPTIRRENLDFDFPIYGKLATAQGSVAVQ